MSDQLDKEVSYKSIVSDEELLEIMNSPGTYVIEDMRTAIILALRKMGDELNGIDRYPVTPAFRMVWNRANREEKWLNGNRI